MKKSKITTAQRRAYVMSMRDAGLSFEDIAREAIKKFGKQNLPKGYGKRLACLDVSRELNKRPANKLKTTVRRSKIMQYRMAGINYQQIVERLREDFGKDELPTGYNASHACRDLQRYMKQIDTENETDIIEAKNLYRERLNFLLNILWEKASKGDFQAIDRTLKIMESLTRLDGLESVNKSTDENTVKSFADLIEQVSKINGNGKENKNGNK